MICYANLIENSNNKIEKKTRKLEKVWNIFNLKRLNVHIL